MYSESDENELMGPGIDLTLAFSGILIIILLLAIVHLWILTSPSSSAHAILDQQAAVRAREQEAVAATIVDLRAKTADQEKQLAAARNQISEMQSRIYDLKNIEEGLRTQLIQGSARAGSQEALIKKQNEDQTALWAAFNQERAKRLVAESKVTEAGRQNQSLTGQLAALQSKLSDQPPLITISDAKMKTFEIGSAQVSPELSDFLASKVEEIKESQAKYRTTVIEVVGHTDELSLGPNRRTECNLDGMLLESLNDRANPADLVPCDNVGLGMARAVAVVNELKLLGLGDQFKILPLSAGDAIDTSGGVATGDAPARSDPARRRIEIRLRLPAK